MNFSTWRSSGLLFGLVTLVAGCAGESGKNGNAPADVPSATASSNNPDAIQKNIQDSDSHESKNPDPILETAKTEPAKPEVVIPKDLGSGKPAAKPADPAAEGVTLVPAKWSDFQKQVVPGAGKKFTLVDAWATWCAPCKENFPHVVEMDAKYAAKGLKVISLSLDDPSDAKAVKEATEFLVSKKAGFTNLLLNEESEVSFEKLNIQAIPAVFIYDASGKEVKRFSLEDPNNLFTYEQVEQTIVALLEGKPVPEFKKAEKPAEKAK